MKGLIKDNKGQGITDLFVVLVIYLALSAAWVVIAADLIDNFLAPTLNVQQFGTIGLTLLRIGAFLLWFIIPIALIGAALRGQRVQG